MVCGIQWNWVEDSDEVFSTSNALKRVLTAMFDSFINANGVFDRVSEEKFQDLVYHDPWIKRSTAYVFINAKLLPLPSSIRDTATWWKGVYLTLKGMLG